MPPAPNLSTKRASKAGQQGQESNRNKGQASDRKKGSPDGKKTKGKERKMHFTVPEGVTPGETLKLMTPRGGEVEVEVPADAKVGKSFAVTIPASSSAADAPKKEATRISVTVPLGAKPGR